MQNNIFGGFKLILLDMNLCKKFKKIKFTCLRMHDKASLTP